MIFHFRNALTATLFLLIFISCNPAPEERGADLQSFDREQLLEDISWLSADRLEGRRTGTAGNRMAQDYIEARFDALGLGQSGDSFRHSFDHTNRQNENQVTEAVNLIGIIEGSENPGRYIAVTAHYDHLGVQNGEIYNGADDNASGTGGLLAAARYFSLNKPENSMIFIAFDAEEQGLAGARHFVSDPAVPLDQIELVLNMDMISNNFENELYAVGTSHYPFLKPMIESVTTDSEINVLFGYDTPDAPQDWTTASDHGPFHQAGIPFIYFGVVDHPHYHQPSDTYENTNPEFYVNTVETIISVLVAMDSRLNEVIDAQNEQPVN
ncbi:MAG: M28 family peptidase [Balneolaceae bacterium]